MSLHDRPTAVELIDAVRDYLLREVIPATDDPRAKFRARIAANVLAIVEREMTFAGEDARAEAARLDALGIVGDTDGARRRELTRQIRAGAWDAQPRLGDALAYARAATRAKLRVANPRVIAES